MISTKFLWRNVLLGGKQQIYAKNSKFEFFESTLYMKSMSIFFLTGDDKSDTIQTLCVTYQSGISVEPTIAVERKKSNY